MDENGLTGKAKATVDWIDKEAPTARLEYSITTKTNQDVVVTLIPSEEVTVLNNGEASEENPNVDPFTYTFMENGEFTFEFKDKAGNIGTATARVDWIDDSLPEAFFSYSTMELTKDPVTVTISFDKENIIIINNDGSNTYTFTENGEFVFMYQDDSGNVGSAQAKVTWIIKDSENPVF